MRKIVTQAALAASGVAIALLIAPIGRAHAQNAGAHGLKPVVGAAPSARPGPAPPPGLPGARGPEGGVAPPTILPSDMQPTDALFDAINRGDITTARDAMGRGADMNAHNVLGMTPLELSIDLSRNDITFYLMSMHPLDSGGAPNTAVAAKAGDAKLSSGKAIIDNAAAGASTRHSIAARAARNVRSTPAATTAPAPSPQYAGGGTPDPAAGFLGFGGGTQIR